ncbi:response regulator [Malaciobacter canalis]|uniref:response regulator n=1 Tax=Malaciobacter canalis TaxID=1912871 RepID=UPI00384EAE25
MAIEKKIEDSLELELLKESTLLFIEDDKEILNEVSLFFKSYFKEVLTSSSKQEALELYKKEKRKIDIILTDLDLPNQDGLELLTEIRTDSSDIPIVLSTKNSNTEVLEKVICLKISNYILKPIKNITTIKILNQIIEENYNKKLILVQKRELELYKDILDKENLVSETDPDGVITYANDIFCEVSGYTKEELLGQPHNIVRHPDNSSKIFKNLWDTIKAGKVWKSKIKNKAKDGSSYYVKATIFPILDEAGNIKKYVSSRFLVTQDEEEKQTLKRYILQQKSQKVKFEQELESRYNDMLKEALEAKEMSITSFVSELQREIKTLRSRINDDKGRILNLEHKVSDANKKAEKDHDDFLQKLSKMRDTTRVSYERYERFKKLNESLKEKLAKAQESIKVYQEYIEEYRHKIDDLNDVIKSYEDDKKKEEEKKASKK